MGITNAQGGQLEKAIEEFEVAVKPE